MQWWAQRPTGGLWSSHHIHLCTRHLEVIILSPHRSGWTANMRVCLTCNLSERAHFIFRWPRSQLILTPLPTTFQEVFATFYLVMEVTILKWKIWQRWLRYSYIFLNMLAWHRTHISCTVVHLTFQDKKAQKHTSSYKLYSVRRCIYERSLLKGTCIESV